MNGIKRKVLHLDEYSVDQDISIVKLNQNESPVDIPLDMKEEIFDRLKKIKWNRYPAEIAKTLAEKISQYTEFPTSEIIIGNGSNELIQVVIQASCDSKDRLLIVNPGFSIYKRLASVMNIDVQEVDLREDFSFDIGSIIKKAREVNLIILASPNNPTGTALQPIEVEEILKNAQCLVVIDEAYYEFYKQTVQQLIPKYPNLIVLRTFSKALNLAGIRLGYLLGEEKNVKELRKVKMPFSVGIFQQAVGEVLLTKQDFIKENVENLIREREKISAELKKTDEIIFIPSSANFLLFGSSKIPGEDMFKGLRQKGVLVRSFQQDSLKDMLRVTVGTPQENDFFLEKLKHQVKERCS